MKFKMQKLSKIGGLLFLMTFLSLALTGCAHGHEVTSRDVVGTWRGDNGVIAFVIEITSFDRSSISASGTTQNLRTGDWYAFSHVENLEIIQTYRSHPVSSGVSVVYEGVQFTIPIPSEGGLGPRIFSTGITHDGTAFLNVPSFEVTQRIVVTRD